MERKLEPTTSEAAEIGPDTPLGEASARYQQVEAELLQAVRDLANGLEHAGHTGPAAEPASAAEGLGPDHVAAAIVEGVVGPDDPLLVRLGVHELAARIVELARARRDLEERAWLVGATIAVSSSPPSQVTVVSAASIQEAAARIAAIVNRCRASVVSTVAPARAGQDELLRGLRLRVPASPELISLAAIQDDLRSAVDRPSGELHQMAMERAMAQVEEVTSSGRLALFAATNVASDDRAAVVETSRGNVLFIRIERDFADLARRVGKAQVDLLRRQFKGFAAATAEHLLEEGCRHVVNVRLGRQSVDRAPDQTV